MSLRFSIVFIIMNAILLALATLVATPQPDVYFVDQYGRVYQLKDDAFEDPRETPLELVEGKEITLKKATEKQKVDGEKVKRGLTRCKNATCRVIRDTLVYKDKRFKKGVGSGTGTAIREDDDYVYVITAGHVVAKEKFVDVYFFHDKKVSEAIEAQVLWNRFNYEFTEEDLCMLRVAKEDFGDFPLPTIIPLMEKGTKIDREEPIISVGCPLGFAASNWTGRTVAHLDDLIPFVPGPLKGRSGAAICDVEAKSVLGVMVRRYETIGVAISADKIRKIEAEIAKDRNQH